MHDRKKQIEALLNDLALLKRIVATQETSLDETVHITSSQWGALLFVTPPDTPSVKDVAKALSISSSAATQLVDGLVQNNFVVRQVQQGDRRSVSLQLTKNIQSKIEQIKRSKVTKFLLLFKSLSDAEFTLYCTLTKKIVDTAVKKKKTKRK